MSDVYFIFFVFINMHARALVTSQQEVHAFPMLIGHSKFALQSVNVRVCFYAHVCALCGLALAQG